MIETPKYRYNYLPMPNLTEQQIAHFWSLMDSSRGPDTCHLWTGTRDKEGYGVISFARKQYRAIRLSVWLARNEDPTGWVVLHSCDNPPCTNPTHLKVSTALENNVGAWHPANRELNNHNGKLTDEQVREIREMDPTLETQTQTAKRYGVTQVLISHIRLGRIRRFTEHRTAEEISKARRTGSNHWKAKLNEDQVREIRALQGTMPSAAIARKFSVSNCTVANILKGRGWLNVT